LATTIASFVIAVDRNVQAKERRESITHLELQIEELEGRIKSLQKKTEARRIKQNSH